MEILKNGWITHESKKYKCYLKHFQLNKNKQYNLLKHCIKEKLYHWINTLENKSKTKNLIFLHRQLEKQEKITFQVGRKKKRNSNN